MSNHARQASGASGKTKRRWTDADEDNSSRPNPPAAVADDYVTYPKRQRVSRACDSCRSKKDKCDGIQPVCSTCTSLCRPCTYKTNPKKRGLPTGYIRSLELLWGLVFSKIQGSEEVVRALLKTANLPSHLASMGKESEGSDTLLASFKNSIVLRDIEKLLTALEQPEEDQHKGGRAPADSPPEPEGSSVVSADNLEWHIPDGLGDGGEISLPTILSPVKTPTNALTGKVQRTTKDHGVQASPPDSEMHNCLLEKSSQRTKYLPSISHNKDDRLRLPPNAWPLLDIYFTYTQCWLPILEKHDILRTAFRYSEENMRVSPTSPRSGDHAALWAALTLASFQDVSITVTRQLTESSKDRPNPLDLYATAKSLIPSEDGIYEIGHVQAFLILSLVKFGQQEWTAAWMLVGQAVRVSQHLGLDQPPGQLKNVDGKAHGRSKHVFLGCFVLETLVAMQTRQIPSLRKDDLTEIGPVNEDGLEEWHPWEDQTGLRPANSSRDSFHRGPLHALSTFNRLVSLVSILNELCCLRQQSAPVSELELLERQLQLWFSAQPKAYRVDLQNRPNRSASPHVFGLEMMYEGTVIVLGHQFAAKESNPSLIETPRRRRAIESSKRLLLLLQSYMETYSLSATCPTFGMILTFGVQKSDKPLASVELDFGLESKLESFSSHVGSVWSVPEKAVTENSTDEVQITDASLMVPVNKQGSIAGIASERGDILDTMVAQSSSRSQTVPDLGSDPRRIDMVNRTGISIDPILSNPWVRTPASLEDSTSFLRTPTPSVANTRTTVEASKQISQLNGAARNRPRQSFSVPKPNHDGSMLPGLPTSFQSTPSQCPPTYNEPNLNLDSFVDIDGYGAPRRPRIAPDLDALFDELASLDGTEK